MYIKYIANGVSVSCLGFPYVLELVTLFHQDRERLYKTWEDKKARHSYSTKRIKTERKDNMHPDSCRFVCFACIHVLFTIFGSLVGCMVAFMSHIHMLQ